MKKAALTSVLLLSLASPLMASSSNNLGIRFARGVPDEQVDLMNRDLAILPTLSVEDNDQSATRLFNMVPTGSNYAAWLAQRSHFIVGQDFKADQSNIKILRSPYQYPNSTLPDIEQGATPAPGAQVKIVMSNLGAGLYVAAKQSNVLFGINLPGIGQVTVNTPRVGLFQIGEGQFMPLLRRQGGTDYRSYANSLVRLSTFMHESRHSDGNGKSLSFVHAVCRTGTYAGYNACDYSSNGPYTVGAVFLRSVTNNCQNCSEAEKEALRNVYADSFSRIISRSVAPASDLDAQIAQTLKDTCDMLRRMNASPSDMSVCNTPAPKAANAVSGDASPAAAPEIWDDAPEVGAN